jgi:hypothetical protein
VADVVERDGLVAPVTPTSHRRPNRTPRSAAVHAMTIRSRTPTSTGIDYDADADVLYLAAGGPERAVDFDETPEGHALRHGPRQRARRYHDRQRPPPAGRERRDHVTLPETISAAVLAPALTGTSA